MNPLLKQLMEQNKGKVICDIGCGCGRNLVYAAKFAQKLIGVDLSTTSLSFAKEFVKNDNLELVEGNNLSIPLEEKNQPENDPGSNPAFALILVQLLASSSFSFPLWFNWSSLPNPPIGLSLMIIWGTVKPPVKFTRSSRVKSCSSILISSYDKPMSSSVFFAAIQDPHQSVEYILIIYTQY